MKAFYVNALAFLAALALLLAAAGPARAAQVTVGLGGGWQSSPYKGHDDNALPMPWLDIEGQRFFVHGLAAGAHLWRGEGQTLSLGVSYFGWRFDPDKTSDRRLKRLDKRDATMNAFLRYSLRTDYGTLAAEVAYDVLGRSEAVSGEASYAYPFEAGPLRLTPGLGLRWDSQKQLEYYYGVSRAEAARSGLEAYRPSSGLSPFAFLSADWPLSEHWALTASGRALFLSREIKDSPMVGSSQAFSAAAGVKYSF